MTLTEFLLARISEDEIEPRAALRGETSGDDMLPLGCWEEHRVLAECAAKRRIVELTTGSAYGWVDVQIAMAVPYADHPDYLETWNV